MTDRTQLLIIVVFALAAASCFFQHSVFLVITAHWHCTVSIMFSIISWIIVHQPEKMVGCLLKWNCETCQALPVLDSTQRKCICSLHSFFDVNIWVEFSLSAGLWSLKTCSVCCFELCRKRVVTKNQLSPHRQAL